MRLEQIDCSACGGTGKRLVDNGALTEVETCDTCKGTGKLTIQVNEKSRFELRPSTNVWVFLLLFFPLVLAGQDVFRFTTKSQYLISVESGVTKISELHNVVETYATDAAFVVATVDESAAPAVFPITEWLIREEGKVMAVSACDDGLFRTLEYLVVDGERVVWFSRPGGYQLRMYEFDHDKMPGVK